MRILKLIAITGLTVGALYLAGCGGDGDTASGPSDTTNYGYTVSGTVSVPNNTAIDSDVNDPNASYRSNDNFNDAQPIPNPVILGGYVNHPNAGADGRSLRIGDIVDSYAVDLSSGQTVSLFIGSDNLYRDDLELLLLDANQTVVEASTSSSNTESLTVPASGRYVVQVLAYSGSSSYVLSIGQDTRAAPQSMSLSADFVPGEVVLQFKPELNLQAQSDTLGALSLSVKAGEPSRSMLVQLSADNGGLHALAAPSGPALRFADAESELKYATLQAVKRLQQRAEVESASPNYILRTQRVPNDGLYPYQWHYTLINLPQAWDISVGSADVVVGVIDTGVLLNHPDLRGKLVDGYDFISDPRTALDNDGIDNNPNDPGDQSSSSGSSFHGSHVAGTIAANTNNANGVAGAGWNTRVMPLRVLGKDGAGSQYDIEQAIRYAAGMSNDSKRLPNKAVDIINLSLGGPSIGDTMQPLLDQVRARGIIVVAAAGNEGSRTPNYPAALNGVVSVSAVDMSRSRADYSNYGPSVDVAAPGGGDTPDINGDGLPDKIFSTLGDDSSGSLQYVYATSQGTSMATPHVAAVIALMKAVHSGLTPQQFDSLLASGNITEDLGSAGRDDSYGYGLIDAHAAVLEASRLAGSVGVVTPPQLSVSPASLNFGLSGTSLTVNVSNAGGGSLSVSRITENSGGYLGLTRVGVDNNGLGTYTATLNRGNLAPGTYTAEYRFESNAGPVTVPVIWQVGSNLVYGDAGYQYVLLVDANSYDTVKQLKLEARNGTYQFSFSGVPAGDYKLVSGTDNDNDFVLCASAESCGAYPLLDRPTTLNVNRNLSGLNFSTSFNTHFLSSSALGDGTPAPRALYLRESLKRLEK